jgi:ATP-dependent DNA ligase
MSSFDALPLRPPLQPMLARLERALPVDEGWLYEPKWDGGGPRQPLPERFLTGGGS